jgi:hypothetical protein
MNHGPEVASSISGGGFSNTFPRPKYQDDAVTTFLQNLGEKQYSGLYTCVLPATETRYILTSQSAQPIGPRHSRHFCAGAQFRDCL